MDRFRPRALVKALVAGAVVSLISPGLRAQALPTAPTVVHGQAQIGTVGNRMTVTNSSGAVIDWRGFSIGADHAVHFQQANSSSQVLNRVVGSDPSQILGSLSSNGRVWLLNPNGVLFGHNARVDVAGLVASTLNLNNSDWLAGRYSLSLGANVPVGAGVINQGDIRTPLGGRVALLGGTVKNEGVISTPGGQIILAAGQQVDLVDTGAPAVQLRVTAPQGEALNIGSLSADGGAIDVQAAIVNQRGVVRADAFALDADGRPVLRAASGIGGTEPAQAAGSGTDVSAEGRGTAASISSPGTIRLVASEALTLSGGSLTSAAGSKGGAITLDSGAGTAWIHGAVDATSSTAAGGHVKVQGRQIGLGDDARIDVSGAGGGGQVFVGGGLKGQDPSLRNAEAVYLGAGASIAADATAVGDGGRIILWSDRSTRAYGGLTARGGPLGGNGGFIETSGGWLDALPARLDVSAPRGAAGEWLLDPYDILITDAATGLNFASGQGAFTPTGPSAVIPTSVINSALAGGANVTISTGILGQPGDAGAQVGDITVRDANIVGDSAAQTTLTLNANRNVVIQRSNLSGNLSFVVNGAGRSTNVGSSGVVSISGSIIRAAGRVSFNAWVGGLSPDLPTTFSSIYLKDSIVSAGGLLELRGGSTADTPQARGIYLDSSRLSGSSIALSNPVLRVGAARSNIPLLISNSQISSTGPISIFAFGYQGAFIEGSTLAAASVDIIASICDCSGTPVKPRAIYLYSSANGTPTSIQASSNVGFTTSGNALSKESYFDITTDSTVRSGGAIFIADASVDANGVAQGAGVTVSGRLEAANQIHIRGSSIRLDGSITSRESGTAITVAPQGPLNLSSVAASGLNAPNGRWLVYGNDPSTTAVSGNIAFKQYNAVIGATNGAPASGGNGVLYALSPTLSFSAVVGKVYDGTNELTNSSIAFPLGGNVTGLVQGDRFGLDLSQSTYPDKNVGSYAVSLTPSALRVVDANGIPVFGYGLQANITGNIRPAPLVITANDAQKRFGDALTFTGTEFTQRGLVAGETIGRVTLASEGAAASADVRQPAYAIVATGVTGGTFDPRNYDIRYVDGALRVLPRPLTGGLVAGSSDLTKVYDGTTTASLSSASVRLTGFVGSDSATINSATGTYDSSNAGSRTVTATLRAQDFTAVGSTKLSNYELPTTVSGPGMIMPAAVQVVASNASKTYGQTVTFTGREFSASGLVGDERIDRVNLTTTGAAAAASVAGGPYPIVPSEAQGGNFAASNYNITYVPGSLSVTPATVSAEVIGTPNKVFDGTDRASLLPGNFGLTGFVLGDGASVTQTDARYDAAAPGARIVTASLSGSSFSPIGTTDLRNYSLPSTATGPGVIAPRPVAEAATSTTLLTAAIQQVSIAAVPTSPSEGRTLDAVQAVSPTSSNEGGVSFSTVSLANMSQDALAALLASRDQLKRSLFGTALSRLAEDPKLADIADCVDIAQLATGNCMITEKLRQEIAEKRRLAALAREAEEQAQRLREAAAAQAAASQQASASATANAASAAVRREAERQRRVVRSALPQISRKIAVVIGIDEYADKSIPKLSNSTKDAGTVGSLLESQLGYEVRTIKNGTKEEIVGALNRLAGEVDVNDSVVIYYAGHGAIVEATGLGYWQPSNAVADKPETWISNSDINKLIGRLSASQVALISDSCFSGSLITGQRLRASSDLLDPSKILQQKSVVIMTSGGNEPVFDAGKNGHSPFAWNLMRNLEKVSGWQAGGNIFERVRFAVAREMPQKPQYAAITEAGHQQGGDYLFEQRELEASSR